MILSDQIKIDSASWRKQAHNYLKGQDFQKLKQNKETFQMQLRTNHRNLQESQQSQEVAFSQISQENLLTNIPQKILEMIPQLSQQASVLTLIQMLKSYFIKSEEEQNEQNLKLVLQTFKQLMNQNHTEFLDIIFQNFITSLIIKYLTPPN